MAETTEQYFERVFRENGLTDAQIQAAMAPVQKLSGDFNAMQGRATAAQRRAQDLENWYPTANAEYQRMMQEKQALEAIITGTPGNQTPAFDTSKFFTKEDVTNMLADRDKRYASVIKDSARIASRHAAKFGEEIDVDAIEKIAMERGIPLQTAYDIFIQPRVAQQQEAKAKADQEAAIKAALDDYKSKHNLPTDPNPPSAPNFLLHKANPDDLPKDQDADLVATWRGANR